MKQEYIIEIETDDLLIDISTQIEAKIKELLEPQNEGTLNINCNFQSGDIY